MSDQSVIRTSKANPDLDLAWATFLMNQIVDSGSYDVARKAFVASWYAAKADKPHGNETCDGWLPIETGPKDEKPILLGCPAVGAMKDPGSTRVFEGRWNSVQKTWTSMNGFLLLTVATHWMPLPEPPSEKASE